MIIPIVQNGTKLPIECVSQCGGNVKCKGFIINSECHYYNDYLPFNAGTLDVDDVWIRGQYLSLKIITLVQLI